MTDLEMAILRNFFQAIFTKTKWDQAPQVMSMREFGQTDPSFGYDSKAQNSVLQLFWDTQK